MTKEEIITEISEKLAPFTGVKPYVIANILLEILNSDTLFQGDLQSVTDNGTSTTNTISAGGGISTTDIAAQNVTVSESLGGNILNIIGDASIGGSIAVQGQFNMNSGDFSNVFTAGDNVIKNNSTNVFVQITPYGITIKDVFQTSLTPNNQSTGASLVELPANSGTLALMSDIPDFQNENIVSSASTLTIEAGGYYSFEGSTSIWTLPTLSGNTGKRYLIMNQGSGIITVNTNAGANDIYMGGTSVNMITVGIGEIAVLYNNSISWFRQL